MQRMFLRETPSSRRSGVSTKGMRMPAPGGDKRAGTPPAGRPTPKLASDRPKERRAPTPKLDRHTVNFFEPRLRRSRARGHFDKSSNGQSEISSTQYGVWWYTICTLRASSSFCSSPSLCSCGGSTARSRLHADVQASVPVTMSMRVDAWKVVVRTCLARSRWTLGLQLTVTVRADFTLTLANRLSASRPSGFEVPGASPSRVSQRLDVVRVGQSRHV